MENKQAADEYLKKYVKKKSKHTMRASEILYFELTGEETERDIEDMANDYISECQSDEAEYLAECKELGLMDDSPSLDMDLNY